MPTLDKLLKPTFLRPYLERALNPESLFGPGAVVLVTCPDKHAATARTRLLAASGGGAECSSAKRLATVLERPDILRQPLRLSGEQLGELLFAPPQAGSACDPAPVLTLLAASLEEIMARELTVRSLGAEVLEGYRERALVQRAVTDCNSSMHPDDVAAALLAQCREGRTAADLGCVLLCREGGDGLKATCILGAFGPTDVLKGELAALPETELYQDIMARGRAEIVNRVESDPRFAKTSSEFENLLLTPLTAPGGPPGMLVLATTSPERPFSSAHLKHARTLAAVAAVSLANAAQFERVEAMVIALIEAMSTAVDARDRTTAGHSRRVAALSLALARAAAKHAPEHYTYSATDERELFYAGLLHDIGKIGVREEVLNKATRLPRIHLELIGLKLALWSNGGRAKTEAPQGMPFACWRETLSRLESINTAYEVSDEDAEFLRTFTSVSLSVAETVFSVLSDEECEKFLTPRGNLTAEEWREIRRHPVESQRILSAIPFNEFFPHLPTIVLQHHERLDGSGYPYGLEDAEILEQSRIMAIVDIYDALRGERQYKQALSRKAAISILLEEARLGKLDARLTRIFVEHLDEIEREAGLGASQPSSRIELVN